MYIDACNWLNCSNITGEDSPKVAINVFIYPQDYFLSIMPPNFEDMPPIAVSVGQGDENDDGVYIIQIPKPISLDTFIPDEEVTLRVTGTTSWISYDEDSRQLIVDIARFSLSHLDQQATVSLTLEDTKGAKNTF